MEWLDVAKASSIRRGDDVDVDGDGLLLLLLLLLRCLRVWRRLITPGRGAQVRKCCCWREEILARYSSGVMGSWAQSKRILLAWRVKRKERC